MRTNTAHIEQLWQQENTQTYLISDLQSLVVNDGEGFVAATIGADRRDAFTEFARVRLYLGSAGGVPYFVLGFEGVHEKIEALLEEAQQFIDLRKVALDLPQEQSAILAYARGIVHWNLRHQHCPDCG
ncbi:MAG: hypothetical protein LPK03_10810, partial [Pontibacter sp.]|nr:hypothetical protein [Pontibacter sp.]